MSWLLIVTGTLYAHLSSLDSVVEAHFYYISAWPFNVGLSLLSNRRLALSPQSYLSFKRQLYLVDTLKGLARLRKIKSM